MPEIAPDVTTAFVYFKDAFTPEVLVPVIIRVLGKRLNADPFFFKKALLVQKSQNESNFLRWELYTHEQISILLTKNEKLEWMITKFANDKEKVTNEAASKAELEGYERGV